MAQKKAFLLRMSPELWEEVSRWASDEFRSVNAHVEFLLRQAVRERRSGKRLSRENPPDSESRGGSSS